MDSHSADNTKAYEELKAAGNKGSLLGKVNQRFQDALQTGRGDESLRDVPAETQNDPGVSADDLAMRRAKSVRAQKLILPEGVIIEGALSSCTETEIEGRIDGDVTVDGRLFLGSSALVSGKVRATTCSLDGLVEGKVDCSHNLELGTSGRLKADAVAGQNITLAGEVFGNITCGGTLRITPTANVTGNVRARVILLEEGANFNGDCIIGAKPTQKAETAPKQKAETAPKKKTAKPPEEKTETASKES